MSLTHCTSESSLTKIPGQMAPESLFPRNEMAGAFHEVAQDVEGLGPERDLG